MDQCGVRMAGLPRRIVKVRSSQALLLSQGTIYHYISAVRELPPCFVTHCQILCGHYFFQETQRLMQEPVPGISAVPDESNARYFHVVVAGERSELLTYSSVLLLFLWNI